MVCLCLADNLSFHQRMRPHVLSIEEVLNRNLAEDSPREKCTALKLLESSVRRQSPKPHVPALTLHCEQSCSQLPLICSRRSPPKTTLDLRQADQTSLTMYLSNLERSVAIRPPRHSYAETTRELPSGPYRLPTTTLWKSLVRAREQSPSLGSLRPSSPLRRPHANKILIPSLATFVGDPPPLPSRPPTAATLNARLRLLSRGTAGRKAAKLYTETDDYFYFIC